MSVPKGHSGNSSRCPGDGGNKDHWKEPDRYACSLLTHTLTWCCIRVLWLSRPWSSEHCQVSYCKQRKVNQTVITRPPKNLETQVHTDSKDCCLEVPAQCPPSGSWVLGQSPPKDVVLHSHLCRKDGKKDQDSRSAPEPKKPEENPASVSVGCLLVFCP